MPPLPRSAEATMIDDENEMGGNFEEQVSVNHEQEEEEVHHNNKRTRKKRKVFAVFDESGLTDADRRKLRQDQRQIAAALRDECQEIEELDHQRHKNNVLFQEKVCFTREAVLDADNVELIVGKYSKHIEMNVQVPRYDPTNLANKLAMKCSVKQGGSMFFDWRSLGKESGVCFNAIPDGVTFLAGSLDNPAEIKRKQARKPRQKEVIDESKEEEPEAVKNNTSDADQLSAAEKNLKQMKHILKNRAKEEKATNNRTEIDGVEFLFNPRSFTQTVENIFNFSFLIKKGEAEIGVNDHSLFVRPRAKPSGDFQEDISTTQAVVAFTMRDWRRIIENRQLTEGNLPHRTGSKHHRAAA